MSSTVADSAQVEHYKCQQCGADLEFKPGSTNLKCPYCGHEQAIRVEVSAIEEMPLEHFFEMGRLEQEYVDNVGQSLRCRGCGAEFSVPEKKQSDECPFCGSKVVVENTPLVRIKPQGVMPFQITELQSRASVQKWLGSRFWAPNDLRKLALREGKLRGFYVPFWTFDSQTTSSYSGMRGEHYWETESYTDSEGNSQTRQVMRTHWYPATGVVDVGFDDVLVLAARTVGQAPAREGEKRDPNMTDARYSQLLSTWQLREITPYQSSFLVGFQALRYDVDLPMGWERAREAMEPHIYEAIRYDIGGDEQRVLSKSTDYNNNSFKHILLPVYTGGYRYRGKPFRIVVNGQTGEVQGEAPVSFWKVLIAVLLALILVGTIAFFVAQDQARKNARSVSYSPGPNLDPNFDPNGFPIDR
ncbi:MAG: hypothetical protein JNJ45_07685 [Chthonomonas sp.]|nr:hypothetical protein [Chthonomonas sp.]